MSIDLDEPVLDGYELHYDGDGYVRTAVLDVSFEVDGEAYGASVGFEPYRVDGDARVRVQAVRRLESESARGGTGAVPRFLAVAVAENSLRERLGESVTLESVAKTAGEAYEREDFRRRSDESEMIGGHDVGPMDSMRPPSEETDQVAGHGEDVEPTSEETDQVAGHGEDVEPTSEETDQVAGHSDRTEDYEE
jgi:hypothetical protein